MKKILIFCACLLTLSACGATQDLSVDGDAAERCEIVQDPGDPACEHECVYEVLSEASCYTQGITKQTCTKCGMCLYIYKDSTEHEYVRQVIREGTCLWPEIISWRCTICGENHEEYGKMGEHEWTDAVFLKGEEHMDGEACIQCGEWHYKEDVR